MALIREFSSRKNTKKNVNRKKTEFEQKIRSHRRSRVMKVLFFSVICILLLFMIYYLAENLIYTYYTEISSYPRLSSSDSVCINYDGKVLTYSKDGISCMDSKGEVIWNETYQMKSPIVEVNKGSVAVGDYGGHIIYVLNEKGKIGEIDTNLPIRDFCISEAGIVAAVLQDQKATKLNIYDTGKILVESESYMNQNGYPVAVALSSDGKVMEVSYLQVDSGSVKSSIAFYNFSEIGQNSVDRFISGYDYDNIVVPYVGFFEDNGAFAVGNGRISFYSGEEKPISIAEKLLSEEIQGVYRGENHVALVFVDTTGAALYRIDLYDKKGNIILSQAIDVEIYDILIQDKSITVYNDTECVMYHMSGREKYRGTFGKSVSLLIPYGKNNRFIMVTPVSVDLIELM